jgi:hypothetical protein
MIEIPVLTPVQETSVEPMGAPIFRDDDPAQLAAGEADKRHRESAFAAQPEWHGAALKPFSISRKACWLQHRVAMGAPDLRRCMADLDGFLADAGRILWLCSVEPGEFDALRADPPAMQAAIDAWMDDAIRPGEQADATLTAFKIYSAAIANRHIPAPAANPHPDDSGN